MTALSTYLFGTPTFAEGVSHLVDFGGTLLTYNDSPTPEIADAIATAADWLSVGDDLVQAIIGFAQENNLSRVVIHRDADGHVSLQPA